jgi:hypothetical protein
MVHLFDDRNASAVLNKAELQAVSDFLELEVPPFDKKHFSKTALQKLLQKSYVLDIESDEYPFSHKFVREFEIWRSDLAQGSIKHIDLPDIQGAKRKEFGDLGSPGPELIEENESEPKNLQNEGKHHNMGDETKELPTVEIENVIYEDEDNIVEGFEDLKSLLNPILYMRGVPTENFYLILQGNVIVCSGNEGFLIKLGPFNFLGLEALTNTRNVSFVPDFSAKVINKARVLMITREQYNQVISHERKRYYFKPI